jgi:hypothetical protein
VLGQAGALNERALQAQLRLTHKMLLPLPRLFTVLVELRHQGLVESTGDADSYPPKDESDWSLSDLGIKCVEQIGQATAPPTPAELFRRSERLGVVLRCLQNSGTAPAIRERITKKGTELSGGQFLTCLYILKYLHFARELFPPEVEQIGAEGWTLTPEGRRFLDLLPTL